MSLTDLAWIVFATSGNSFFLGRQPWFAAFSGYLYPLTCADQGRQFGSRIGGRRIDSDVQRMDGWREAAPHLAGCIGGQHHIMLPDRKCGP